MNNNKRRAGNIAYKIKRFLANPLILNIMKNKTMIISIIYMLSPIDIIPDAIPIVGNFDDLFLILTSFANILENYSNGNLTATVINGVNCIENKSAIVNGVSKITNKVTANGKSEVIKNEFIICSSCGTANSSNSRFCIECGKEL